MIRARSLHPRLAAGLAFGSLVNTEFALAHSLRTRGRRGATVFAALGLGVPTLAEWLAINVSKQLRHHSRPQLAGVPLNATAGWYTIAYATFTLSERLLTRAGAGARVRRWATPAGTALLATNLDLLLDPYGLASGMWEWRDDGPYAPEIVGLNGQRGIPILNFLSWLGLTGGVTFLYGLLHGDRQDTASISGKAAREAALLLAPYYLPAALWALRNRQPRYLLYSAPFAVAAAITLRPQLTSLPTAHRPPPTDAKMTPGGPRLDAR
jgi:uncharacterized membrane protein